MTLFDYITLEAYLLSMLSGAVIGLLPFFVGKYTGKPNLGMLGFKWTIAAGLLFLSVPTAIGFVVAMIVRTGDYYPPQTAAAPAAPMTPTASPRIASLGITCLSGPMKGRTYLVSENGIMIGRDHDCAIRFDAETPGISRHHCSLRWQGGVLMLTDLNSAYGTFLADGRKLPPQYPMQVSAGSRFYLADTRNLFQIVITT